MGVKLKYDVIVVGAGPAGSTAAKFLSERGTKVLLLDKSKFPRDKPCGGGLTTKVLQRFKYTKDLVDSYSYGGCVYSSSLKYKVEVEREEPILAMVLRKKFDYGLVKLAIDAGTTFIESKKVEDVKILNDRAKLLLSDGSCLECELVIGADGVWSTVAKKSGITRSKDVGTSLLQEIPVSVKTLNDHFTEKRYCYLHLKVGGIAGYGWVFPKKKHVNIGVGEIRSSKTRANLKEVYKKYVEILKKSKIIPEDLKIGKVKGGALPIHPVQKTYGDRILLCGDAAGLINPFTGEGIDYAMYSGKIAADTAVNALEENDTSSRFLSKYEKTWKKEFGKDIKLFLRSSRQWEKNSERIMRLVSKDEKISEMLLDVIIGNLSIHECKWKLIRRYIYLALKDLMS
jgi:geranylgeranyl reductase family protein